MAFSKRLRPGKFVTTTLLALLLSAAVSTVLTAVSSLLVCAGLHPESMETAEKVVPLLGLLSGAAWAGARAKKGSWWAGLAVGVSAVAVWFAGWCYLTGRLNPALWSAESWSYLSGLHFLAWAEAVAAGLAGGIWGGGIGRKPVRAWMRLSVVLLAALALVQTGASVFASQQNKAGKYALRPGITLEHWPVLPDGTTVRLFTFDFGAEPKLSLGLYDADLTDANPRDDRCTTWLGRNSEFVFERLRGKPRAAGTRVFCVFNAGFFNLGIEHGLYGSHVAPVVVNGKAFYNVSKREGDWTFGGIERSGGSAFKLVRGVPFSELDKDFDTAIGYVRPLVVDGNASPLSPGLGNTRLRCSRTSIGWSEDSKRLYVLVVRDADGEAAGVTQMKSGSGQTGGWDVAQVQRFWKSRKVPYALLLDGGDSTQVTYRSGSTGFTTARGGYHLSRTLGYWKQRPIRIFVPMLPSAQSHNGVINYLYVSAPK